MSDFEAMNIAQLKDELRAHSLPLSGRKLELVQRLQDSTPEDGELMLDAEIISDESSAAWRRTVQSFLALPVPVIIVVGMLMVGSLGYVGYELISAWADDEVEYPELIEFNSGEARVFAQNLVGFGHNQWEGRMSGSQEELNAAQYIRDTFDSLGYEATLENFSVPMFSIVSAPTLQLCIPGDAPLVPKCVGIPGSGDSVTDYEHRTQVVLQGYSGTRTINFGQADVIFLGNGSEEQDWASASDNIGMVYWGSGGVSGNTQIYSLAAEHGLAALIVVNIEQNCGNVEADNCVPIFKSINVEAVIEANGGTMPDDISFVMVSSEAGYEITDAVKNESAMVAISTNVQNTGELDVRVPCGKWEGLSNDLLIVGAHHDTVYNGPGAVDDTSGSATVLELATVFSNILSNGKKPYYTIMFCTWGGEEEGLWGSSAWVAAHQQQLRDHLRLYINLDMNHVDVDSENRGNSISLFSNSEEDLEHIKAIADIFENERPDVAEKYSINFRLLDGASGSEDAMPYNSDHAPFVYELGEGENGRAAVCYGSGSWEYHTYADDLSHFNEESLSVSGTIYGTYLRFLAEV